MVLDKKKRCFWIKNIEVDEACFGTVNGGLASKGRTATMALEFNQAFFEQFVHGGPQYSDVTGWELLGSADKFLFEARTAQATGTSPTLTVILEHSNDGVNWTTKSTPINAASLTADENELNWGNDSGSTPMSRYGRLNVQIGGTSSPGAHVMIIVTGRSE